MKKRILSIILTLSMLFSVLPLTPFTAIAATTADPPAAAENTVMVGDFTIKPTDVGATLIEGADYTYSDHVLTVCSATGITVAGKTTADRIEVASGVDVQVTLAGVDIDVSGDYYHPDYAAFKIADDSTGNVTVVLASGTENSLISGGDCAGLQKNGDGAHVGTLTIRGEGALTARCEGYVSLGAGIGGGDRNSTANIRIIGANITATSRDAAGIGGGDDDPADGYGGNLTNITIENSVVNATSSSAAGIGGGNGKRRGGDLTNIVIKNSVVNATSSSAAGIGGGHATNYYSEGSNLTNITIENSVVNATSRYSAGIGGGNGGLYYEYPGTLENLTLIGSSVKASSIGTTPIDSDSMPLILASGKELIKKGMKNTSVAVDGVEFPAQHNYYDDNSNNWVTEDTIYPYLSVGYHELTYTVEINRDGAVTKTEPFRVDPDGGITFDPYSEKLTQMVENGFTVYGDKTDYTYTGGVLNITGTSPIMVKNTNPNAATNHRIEVESGANAHVTLAGVHVDVSADANTAAFLIENYAHEDVTVVSAAGTQNKLISGKHCAGLQKNGATSRCTLYICGSGELWAQSGTDNAGFGAGIGGAYLDATANIRILGANVTAVSYKGAGIGGGLEVDLVNDENVSVPSNLSISNSVQASNITIQNSTVMAKSAYGNGIGGGNSTGIGGNLNALTIENSAVQAIGAASGTADAYGVGIGGGNATYNNGGNADGITIRNSTVTASGHNAPGIGSGRGRYNAGELTNFTVEGSSIKANGVVAIGKGATDEGSAVEVAPKDADGKPLYLLTLFNPDDKPIEMNGKSWTPVNHKAVDASDSTLYAYISTTDDGYAVVSIDGVLSLRKYSPDDKKFKSANGVVLLAADGTLKAVYSAPQAAVDASVDGDTVMLFGNFDLSATLDISKKITLDVNGYVLKRVGSGSVINIASGAALTLKDSNPNKKHKFTPGTDGLWALDEATGTETVTGGIITGGSHDWGGGVYNSGTFKMAGGSIVGCKASRSGGGVINNGTFIMQSGNIAGCTAQWGGGVMNNGTATLSGSITDCEATKTGGAVQIDGGTLTLQNGKLENCTAKWGGGVYNKSTFTLKSGTISGCTATEDGGGVINESTFTMEAGKLENCTAKWGGGVINEGTFTMEAGKLENCTGTTGGGGVFNKSTFVLKSGNITGCSTSSKGGGVFNDTNASFTMEAGTITCCTATEFGGGVYMYIGANFSMKNGTISGCTAKWGGGVRVYTGANFSMKNGTISGCTATEDGGGVYQVNNTDIIANGGSIIGDVRGNGRITRSDDATDYTTFTGTVSATNIDPKACPYTVTFDSNGGSAVATQYVLKGQAPKTLANPTKEHFTFERWHTEASKTAYDFSAVLTQSVALFADWSCAQHSGGTATCKDQAVCEHCGEKYGEVDSNNHDLENIKENAATVTETGNIEYWHCKDCDNNFSDESGKTKIDLKDTVTPKLPPEIIDGQGQSLTAGEKKELTFRSNAAYSDFIRVEVDGETVDENNYTVKEGSTIVTLKADYVATLSVGEHTLGIVSESGTATTTFTVNAKVVDTNSPQTGDNSHMALWFALLFVSGGLLTVTGVYGKKKKYSAK